MYGNHVHFKLLNLVYIPLVTLHCQIIEAGSRKNELLSC